MPSSLRWLAPSRGLGLTCPDPTGTAGTNNGDPIRVTFVIRATAASGAERSAIILAFACPTIVGMTSVVMSLSARPGQDHGNA